MIQLLEFYSLHLILYSILVSISSSIPLLLLLKGRFLKNIKWQTLGKLHSWQKLWNRKCKQKPKELEGIGGGNQYNQNKMFEEDTKKFYWNLGMKNIEASEPPSIAETETYWKSLWGEAQHNERAEWIRREQKRKISHMDWRYIQITEITSYL